MGLIKLILAVVIGGFVLIMGGCFALVGGVTHVARDVSKGEKLDNTDIYFVSQPRPAERQNIVASCQTAFASGKAMNGAIRGDFRSSKAKANAFCACVVDGTNDMSTFDRHVLVASLDESALRQVKLNVGLEKAGLDASSVKARTAEAKRRNADLIKRCVVDQDLK
jgi:hypothetical protein